MTRSYGKLLIAVALLTLVGTSVLAQASREKPRRAPAFSLGDWRGTRVSLDELRGRTVVLQFFQVGCPVCRHEAPLLEEIYQEYKDRGVVVIGISHDRGGADDLQKFAEQFGVSFPLLIGDLEVAVRYIGVTPQRSSFSTPHFFLINGEGYIVREFVVGRDPSFFADEKQALKQALDELLASSPPEASRAAPGSSNR